MQNTTTADTGSASQSTSSVERVRTKWVKSLIDVSRRNNLLFYRDLKRGTLDITTANPAALAGLLSGSRTRLIELIANGDPTDIAATALQIQRRAQANLEERGLQTLFIAYGMAAWPAPDSIQGGLPGRPYEAAVLLIPASIEIRARDPHAAAVQIIGDPEVNLALLHVLANDHGCVVDPEVLLRPSQEDEAPDPAIILNRLRDMVVTVPGFTVKDRLVLGNFSFQKMAMVSDLQQHAELFAANDVLASLAGDDAARQRLTASRTEIEPRQLDKIPAENEFLVLDADSSQQRVIYSVLKLQSGVIQGPPGTGKSQTIVNLIAALVAAGQRVLFVAEKRAALDVVLNRLERIGLGHLALDLHDTDANRAEAMRRIGKSLESIGATPPVNVAEMHARFEDRRSRLNAHDALMHVQRPPAAMSIYELQGYLLRAKPESRCAVRWRGADLDHLTRDNVARIRDLLKEAGGFAPILRPINASPWARATLSDGHAAQQAIDLVGQIARQRLPELQTVLDEYAAASHLHVPDNQADLGSFIRYLTRLAALLDGYSAELFEQNLAQMAQDLAPARNLLSRAVSSLFNAQYRVTLKTIRQLRRVGAAQIGASQVLQDISAAVELQKTWRKNAGDPLGRIPDRLPEFEMLLKRHEALNADLLAVMPFISRLINGYETRKHDELIKVFGELDADTQTPYQLPRANEIRAEVERLGGGAFLKDPATGKANPDLWPDQFEYAWLASCMDKALAQETLLSGFVGNTYNTFVSDFKDLDRRRVAVAVDRVQRVHAERAINTLNQYQDQLHLVQRELEKKRRQMPLRKLLASAPDVLTAICPCWMASPLSVSQLFASDRKVFDIVLFDEASQIPPEDAAPAIMRATHVVVAGDKHQLPPTRFFASEDTDKDEDGEEQLSTEGFESLLDLMSALSGSWWLDWHYRSHDESLIAFSNQHIYSNRLITFPSVGGERALSHVLVTQDNVDAIGHADMTRSNPAEARRVVQMIIEHACIHPHESLGVIALGIRHAQRIQDELDRALPSHPELDEFFSRERDEPFFIKNLERVQGDERDAIILSVGYGKDQNGKLPYRFGPLLQQGGERRLNVAVTRARVRMTLVSSFSHTDMDPNRAKARGVELLRLYLEYAASQGRTLSAAQSTAIALNAFESEVRDALTAKGMHLVPQWGVSGYRIDFVVQHPDHPGSFVLAIECDGASYHSAPTARDRDRLRQQQLEALGWTFHRIWSTDWFFRRDAEIERVMAVYQQAVKRYDERTANAAVDVADPPALPTTPAASAPQEPVSPAPQRKPRPTFPLHNSISEYSNAELVSLVRWIESDGLLRTQDAIKEEIRSELGFKRRGPRIDEAIRRAIAAADGKRP
jgi:very-short-patch-repair endonuclease